MKQFQEDLYKKFTDEELLDLQKRFNKSKKLKFKKEIKINSLEDIINNIFKRNGASTYVNTNNRAQCAGNKQRSVEDIYRVCRTYFKDISLKEVYEAINYLRSSGQINKGYCSHVEKVVHSGYRDIYKLDNKYNIIKNAEIPSRRRKKTTSK